MYTGKSRKIMMVANAAIALTWLYHGIVPKLMYMETGELSMVSASGLFPGFERQAVYIIGMLEILFGLAFLVWGKTRIFHYLNIAALSALAITAFAVQPSLYLAPFYPASTSFGVIGMSLIVLVIRSGKNEQQPIGLMD